MKIIEEEREDRYGNYPIWIKGSDATPQKIHEELFNRFGGQGYKFAIIFDVSKDEWEDPEKETPIYFMDELTDPALAQHHLPDSGMVFLQKPVQPQQKCGQPVSRRAPEHSSFQDFRSRKAAQKPPYSAQKRRRQIQAEKAL